MNVDVDFSAVGRVLRGAISELREKRLWPVAVALLVAIVAVPVLLSNSPSSPPVAAVPQPAPPPAGGVSLPAINVQSTPAKSRLTGSARDPFTQQKTTATASTTRAATPTTAAATASAASTVATVASAARSAAAATTSTTPASSSPTPPSNLLTPTTTTHKITYYYDAVDLSFGKLGTKPKSYRNAARLHIFPSGTNPVVVYLGLKRDAKTAVFMVSSSAAVKGAGKCLPSASSCAFLDLKVGQQEVLVIGKPGGGLQGYSLKVRRVRVVQVDSAAAAARMATTNVSHRGQAVVANAQRLAPDLPWPSFSPRTGYISGEIAPSADGSQAAPDVRTGAALAVPQTSGW